MVLGIEAMSCVGLEQLKVLNIFGHLIVKSSVDQK